MKVVEHGEISKLHFGPMIQFGPEVTRIGIPPWLLSCPPPICRNASMGDAWRAHGCHARVRAPSFSAARPGAPMPTCRSGEAPQRLPIPLHPRLAFSLALCRLQSGGTMATTRALSFLTVSPLQCFSTLAGCALVIRTERRSFHALFFTCRSWLFVLVDGAAGAAAAGYMARPPKSGSGQAEWCGGCGKATWCFPTPASSPTRPQPAGVFVATRDLGLEYETTQGSRCKPQTYMNSASGLRLDLWKTQGSRGKSVFLFLLF